MALPDVDREYHYGQLLSHCRVRSYPFKDKAYRYACTAQKDAFWDGIDITITTDSARIHPPSLCNNCFPLDVYKWSPTQHQNAQFVSCSSHSLQVAVLEGRGTTGAVQRRTSLLKHCSALKRQHLIHGVLLSHLSLPASCHQQQTSL